MSLTLTYYRMIEKAEQLLVQAMHAIVGAQFSRGYSHHSVLDIKI